MKTINSSLILFLISISCFGNDSPLLFSKTITNKRVFCHSVHYEKDIYLTAAHCVKHFEKETISIGEEKIQEILYHKKYFPIFSDNQLDFAAVRGKPRSGLQITQNLKIGDKIKIKNLTGMVVNLTDTEFRVEFPSKAPCYTDSGRGAYINGKLVGILSRGHKKCIRFGIFTKISIIENWLELPSSINKYLTNDRKKLLISMLQKKLGVKK